MTDNRAPGQLELVRAFTNTNDVEAGSDELGSPERLRAWLVERELLDAAAPVTEADWRRTVAAREALRTLALANNGEPLEHAALDTLNAMADRARLAVAFEPGGTAHLVPSAAGVDAVIARLLGVVFTAMAEGRWPRLKACRNDTCQWLFYDHSKNRSGTWCTMAVCGNRVKARTYRRRHQGNRQR